jgi:hypothetical protein
MNDIKHDYATADADVLYIGYPKSASVFVGKFLEGHPEVTTDHNRIAPLLLHANWSEYVASARPAGSKVHVCRDEGVAESICVTGDIRTWQRNSYLRDAWNEVKGDIRVDPGEAASRLRKVHPRAKVLMVIREQANWLNSVYKYSVNQLPAGQRSFTDYCTTPYGNVMLDAGHYDRTIGAYADVFGGDHVCVLKYEDIVRAPEAFTNRLCAFVGISPRPLPARRENESHAQLARLLKLFPTMGQLPRGWKDAIKPHAAWLLPGGGGMLLSSREVRLARSMYAMSNERTERLIAQLWSAPRRMDASA